jgi:valyl-tRNA synthetase
MSTEKNPSELSKGYESKQVEKTWYQFWLDKNYFAANEDSKKPTFSMVIPPPNVTGVLHMGHALNNTLQDILARFKRMQGYNVLWIPGMDHAGIATQIVVEKQLAKEGIKREVLGRDKFVEKVWEWKEKSGGLILDQQKRLGISVDWPRQRFTLDEGLSKAVRKVFVDLYNEGLIYRGNRLVNWCPRCQTAISDLEVKHTETKGSLWHIKYPIAGSGDFLVVATTRPETMLGDTAVAVNPKDSRYKKYVGQKVKLPLTNREIPIIEDSYVEQTFGSGVVKITPAHDFNDYEMAARHKLPKISILDSKGIINDDGGSYKGLKVVEARKKVIEDLTNLGLLLKEEPHTLSVGKCDRCETIIEPRLSDQWFVKIKTLAEPAIKVVEDKKIVFFPENWTKTYLDWMYNINDWCISRQLWWGHRIPAWHCETCKKHIVSLDTPKNCPTCEGPIVQDTDVLDTWFSSALWPFTTMGWPEKTKILENFYPTTALVTGFDIIFFWVARMIMMGMHFMKDIPFQTVYIHALIRDERGQKMSKSKGNVVDPLELVNDYGTDALRFTLASLVGGGRDIKFSEDRLDGYRNFINKIWNATRFALNALKDVKVSKNINEKDLALPDRYIVYELKETIRAVTKALEEYRFTDAANSLYKFTWNEFCDWYLELSKPVLYGTDANKKSQSGAVLLETLNRVVKLLHPFTPFVTEEVYQLLPDHGESVMIQSYPKLDDPFLKYGSDEAAKDINLLKEVVTVIRNIRGENRISPAIKISIRISSEDQEAIEVLKTNDQFLLALGRLEKVEYSQDLSETKKCAVSLVSIASSRINVIIPLEGLVDFNEEIKRIQKELERNKKDLDLTQGKLSSENFMKNAPTEIVAQEKERISQLTDKAKQLKLSLERLKA